jgi:hypothetical protein
MTRIFGATVALAIFAVFLSSAQAAIKIEIAEVQNGFAFIKGNNAARSAQIIWDGNAVTTANKQNGGFSFTGAVPHDCIGELSDGVSTINVQVLDCTPVSAAPAPVPRTGQTTSYAASDDGALQRGVVLPTPRFTDNSNGMITDNLTGLIWLKNANCPNANAAGTSKWNGSDDFKEAGGFPRIGRLLRTPSIRPWRKSSILMACF